MGRISILIALVLVSLSFLNAQRIIDEVLSVSDVDEISLEAMWGDVEIRKSTAGQLRIEGKVSINRGENNDAFDLNIQKSGSVLSLTSDIKDMENLPRYTTIHKNGREYYFRIPPGEDFDWSEIPDSLRNGKQGWTSNGVLTDISLMILVPEGVKLQVESTYGDITLSEVTNDMNIKNTYGHIEATLPRVPSNCTLESVYSFVDVSIPSSARSDLKLQTNYGEIYSNVDFTVDKGASKWAAFENRVVAALNGGGSTLDLTATYNNIYLRYQ